MNGSRYAQAFFTSMPKRAETIKRLLEDKGNLEKDARASNYKLKMIIGKDASFSNPPTLRHAIWKFRKGLEGYVLNFPNIKNLLVKEEKEANISKELAEQIKNFNLEGELSLTVETAQKCIKACNVWDYALKRQHIALENSLVREYDFEGNYNAARKQEQDAVLFLRKYINDRIQGQKSFVESLKLIADTLKRDAEKKTGRIKKFFGGVKKQVVPNKIPTALLIGMAVAGIAGLGIGLGLHFGFITGYGLFQTGAIIALIIGPAGIIYAMMKALAGDIASGKFSSN